MDKFFQLCRAQQAGAFQPHGTERRAVGPHEPCNGRADDRRPQLLLKGPKNGVIEERAPLDDDMLPQLLGRIGPDDLIDRVFDDADGEPGGNILHRRAVPLGLLDGGIHKDGAPGAQIHRRFGTAAPSGQIPPQGNPWPGQRSR